MRSPMPAPYGQDLRRKAIEAVESGRSVSEVSDSFDISRSALSAWLKRFRETGSDQAITHYQKGHSQKITDWRAFKAFAEEHGDKTQAEMAQLWPEQIDSDTIGKGLKRIGFTRKKRLTLTASEMKINEARSSRNSLR